LHFDLSYLPYCKQQVRIMAKNPNKLMAKIGKPPTGQALVEFALIIGFVLAFAFIIIESARMFQAWQTLQNAAREAGRYALTGNYDPACLSATPPCYDPRVHSIRQRALASTTGLIIDPAAGYNDPNFFYTEIIGSNEEGVAIPEYAGASNQPVYIRVTYRMAFITPFLSSLPPILLTGSILVNNEDFEQFGSTVTNPTGPPVGFAPPPPQQLFPDLWLQKESVPESVVVNGEYDYRLTVYNVGNIFATGVVLTDTLPIGVAFVSATPGFGCAHNSGVVVCSTLGDIPPNPNLVNDPALRREVTIRVRAPQTIAESPTNIVNTATVRAAQFEQVLSNNTDTATTQVISLGSDMQILSMETTPNPITQGQNGTLNITVGNNGPNTDPATNVVVTTNLDERLTFQASPGCVSNGGSPPLITCAVGTVNEGATAQVAINFTTNDAGAITHVANVSALEDDPLLTNNTMSSTTNVVPAIADLRVTKTSSPSSVMRLQEVTYLIQVVNNGPSTATDIVVTDTLPAGSTFISASAACVTPPVNGVLTCNIASLTPNLGQNTVNLSVVVRSPNNTNTMVNRADVSANEGDPNTSNNTAFASTQIIEVDLAVEKQPRNNPQVNVGVPFDFTILVTNNGPSPATGVFVSDPLHTTFSFVSATPSQGACARTGGNPDGTGGTVNCNIGSLAVGAQASITLRIVPTVGGGGQGTQYTNTATVSGNQGDPVSGNNQSSASIQVRTTNNAFITVQPGCADPGATVTVRGYNFSTNGNRSLTISMNPGNYQLYTQANFAQANWQQPVTIPANAPLDVTYTIQAVRHTEDPTVELRVPCPKPDLVISNLQLGSSTPITSYTPITFTAVVANVGDIAAVNQFYVSLYLNPPTPAVGATFIPETYRMTGAVVGISGLQRNESRLVTITAIAGLPNHTTTPIEPHRIYAVVDSDPSPTGLINERNETNNIAGPLQVTVDFEGEAPPPPPEPGDEIGELRGTAYTEQPGLGLVQQPFTPVYVYNESNILIDYMISAQSGFYRFPTLPVGVYNVAACISLDGLEYFVLIPGIPLAANDILELDLTLQRQACWSP
jgi:uncharacterized repeat protein (TIGR01451 family)